MSPAAHTLSFIRQHVWLQVLVALFLGIFSGFMLSADMNLLAPNHSLIVAQWLAFPGYLFLGVIKIIIIPLILSSVFCGIADTKDAKMIRILGFRIVAYFVLTTFVALAIGIGWTLLLQPGEQFRLAAEGISVNPDIEVAKETISNWPSAIVGILPDNIFNILAAGDLLKVVIFAAIFGTAMLSLSADTRKPLIDVAYTVQEGCLVVVNWAMKLVPYAVFGLIAYTIATTGISAVISMVSYMFTILLGLLTILACYLLAIKFYAGMSIRHFLSSSRELMLLAFSTSSSSAVMPVTLQTAEKKLGFHKSIARFVVPTGTTINMDGTAMYQAAATIFLAQAFGVDLTMGEYAIVIFTALWR